MQVITVSGRLGKDAESRTTQGGDQVTSFNMAVDQGYGDRKQSNWFRVSIWGKKGAGAAPYLRKGGVVTVVGELEFGDYEGKVQYNIRAHDFTLPPKQSGTAQQSGADGDGWVSSGKGGGGFGGDSSDELDSDVPFAHCMAPVGGRLV